MKQGENNFNAKVLEGKHNDLTAFTYVSSHDLQESLRKIQTFSSRILEKEEKNLSVAGKEYFQRMQIAANRIQNIIEDLNTYSNINNAEKKFEKTDLDMIMEHVRKDLNNAIVEKKATIETDKFGEAFVIPNQFYLLMFHLISNSLKYSDPDKQVHIKIKVKKEVKSNGEKHREHLRIEISDNGIGFEPKFNDQIFEVFQRLHSKDEYEGTGIGLAICKKIVENHNGTINATGQIKKGAHFEVCLPCTI